MDADSPGHSRSYLFIRLKGIGEVVMLLPLVDMIWNQDPDSRIEFVVGSPCQEILESDPRIDRVHVVDWRTWKTGRFAEKLRGYQSFSHLLRGRMFDLVVDFHGNRDTQGLAWLCRCRRRVGRASGRWTDILLDQVYPVSSPALHNTEALARLLRSEGVSGEPGPARVHLSRDAGQWVEEWIRGWNPMDRPLYGLNPGAGLIAREWPAERYAALGRALVREKGAVVIVHGSQAESPLVEGVCSVIGPDAVPLVAPRLDHLGALTLRMEAFITNDTGPMHLAAAAGARVVGLFGGNLPGQTGPYRAAESHPIHLGIECSPCGSYKSVCWHRRCLNDLTHGMVLDRLSRIPPMTERARP